MKHYADGKVRGETERIRQLEQVYGIDKTSPYGTNYGPIFEEKINKIEGKDTDSPHEREMKTLKKLNSMALKAGVIVAANVEEQRRHLRDGFRAYQSQNPPNYFEGKAKESKMDMRKKSSKKVLESLDYARTKSVFEKEYPTDTPESFKKLLNTYTLSDLQHLAAKAGFNPSFDRGRTIETLVEEFSQDWKRRSSR